MAGAEIVLSRKPRHMEGKKIGPKIETRSDKTTAIVYLRCISMSKKRKKMVFLCRRSTKYDATSLGIKCG